MSVETTEATAPVDGFSRDAIGTFAEAVQEIVNAATKGLSVVEIVGVLELVKSELLAVSRERSFANALDEAMNGVVDTDSTGVQGNA